MIARFFFIATLLIRHYHQFNYTYLCFTSKLAVIKALGCLPIYSRGVAFIFAGFGRERINFGCLTESRSPCECTGGVDSQGEIFRIYKNGD